MIDVDWDLLFRYLGGECTSEERVRFEGWLAADPSHRALLDAAAVAGERVLGSHPPTPPAPRVLDAPRRVGSVRRASMLAAASLAIAAGSALLWRAAERAGDAGAEVEQVAVTGRGERDTLHLEDGTRVILGAASTLRHPARFAAGAREVHLTGEGYFEVVHDERRPFRVHAGRATAEDLGTAFSVRAYAGDSAVQVVVAEGLVALGPAAKGRVQGTVLTPGQLGRLPEGSAVPSVERVDVEAYLGWTRGELVFDDTPLAEVAAQLGRWYGAELRLADGELASRRLSGRFATESLAEVLAVVGPALDVRFEHVGDTVVVRAAERRR